VQVGIQYTCGQLYTPTHWNLIDCSMTNSTVCVTITIQEFFSATFISMHNHYCKKNFANILTRLVFSFLTLLKFHMSENVYLESV
jgi:hypothetical protein